MNRWRLAVAVLAATAVVAVVGIPDLQFNSHYTAYFDADDQRLQDHREISRLYSRQDALFIVLQAPQSFLGEQNYVWLETLTDDLQSHPATRRVVSVTGLGIIGESSTDDGYLIPSLSQIENESRAMNLLLSQDGRVAGIWVQVELENDGPRAVIDSVGSVRQLVEQAITDRPVTAHYTGTLAMNEAYIKVVRQDLSRLLPLLLLLMIVVPGLLTGSWRAVLAALSVGLAAVVAAFGLLGLLCAELAAINSFVPIMILSISVAGCLHMVLTFGRFRSSGDAPSDAAVAAAKYNLLPMALANGTTAIGFLGLTLSSSPPVRLVGYLVATGIVVSFLLCMTLLPALLARLDARVPSRIGVSAIAERAVAFVAKRRFAIVAFFLVAAVPASWSVTQNVISDNVLSYFSSTHEFAKDTQLVESRLSGANELMYSLDTGREYAYFDAASIDAVSKLTAWLRTHPVVRHAVSIADAPILKEAMHEGRMQERLDFYRVRVASRAKDSLLSLELSEDFSSSLLRVYLRQLDSTSLMAFDAEVHAWVAENLTAYSLRSGGPALMFAELGERNIREMLTALGAALLLGAVALGLTLRSARIAWVSLVCNILPVLFVYSIWAVFSGQINIGAAIVMGMILGIVLDDTIYLLSAYRRERQRGAPTATATAVQRVAPALIVTTVTLLAGLSLGMASDFGPIWNMSVLSVSVIGTALIVDLLLLPALLPRATLQEGSV